MAFDKEFMIMAGYWALFLALTMTLFEQIGLTPDAVGGFIGWLFVEFGRVILGFFLFDFLHTTFLAKGKVGGRRGRK